MTRYEPHGRPQDQNRLTNVVGLADLERHHVLSRGVVRRSLGVERGRTSRRDLSISVRPRHAGLEARDDFVVVTPALAGARRTHRRPDIHGLFEAHRCDADDRGGCAAQSDGPADHRTVTLEETQPQSVTDDRGARAARAILVGRELAADGGLDAEHAEVAGRDPLFHHVLGMVADQEVDAGRSEAFAAPRRRS